MVSMADRSYEEIDDLFAQVRLRLVQVRQSDPATAEDLKGLIRQLEDWVESLVVDSLKLKSLGSKAEGKTATASRRQKKQGGK